jgi:hypothetical protein
MHQAGAHPVRPSVDWLPASAIVTGEVVCHHPFGLGIRLHDRDKYGHVDPPFVSSDPIRGPEDYPPIGMIVRARVVGYAGARAQLRLHLEGVHQPSGGAGPGSKIALVRVAWSLLTTGADRSSARTITAASIAVAQPSGFVWAGEAERWQSRG